MAHHHVVASEACLADLEVVKEAKNLEVYAEAVQLYLAEQVDSCQVAVDQTNSSLPCLDRLACCKGQRECKVDLDHPGMMAVAHSVENAKKREPVPVLRKEDCPARPTDWRVLPEAVSLPGCLRVALEVPVVGANFNQYLQNSSYCMLGLTEIGGTLALVVGWY